MKPQYLFMILSGIFYGFITFGGEILLGKGLSAYEITAYSMLMMWLLVLPFFIGKNLKSISKQTITIFILLGLFNALQELSQFFGLAYGVPVAVVALLLYSQTIWVVFLSKYLLKESITKKKLLAGGLAILGIVILVNPFNSKIPLNSPGLIFSFLGGFFLALWTIYTKKLAHSNNDHTITSFGFFIFTFLWLAVLFPILNILIKNKDLVKISFSYDLGTWVYVLGFAILSGLIPLLFFLKSIEKMSATTCSIILLLEPVSASILATIFLGQEMTLNMMIGGGIILLSNYLVIKSEN